MTTSELPVAPRRAEPAGAVPVPPCPPRDPDSLSATLTTVAETAAALTSLLDGLCRQYTREPAIRQAPICVDLDQAAAAAHDLQAAAEHAARVMTADPECRVELRLPRQEPVS